MQNLAGASTPGSQAASKSALPRPPAPLGFEPAAGNASLLGSLTHAQ